MMIAIEIICLCLILVLCFICTKTDLQSGMIYNKVLVIFLMLAGLLDVIYYGIFVQDLLVDFLINVTVVASVSLFLFFSHSFAGGDCKMMLVISLLFPARFYWGIGNSNITFVYVIALAIFAGYCYLLVNSLWAIITNKVNMTANYIKEHLLNFLKSYLIAMLYISLFNQIISVIFGLGISVNIWIIRIMCLGVAWCIGKYSVFRRWFLFVPATCFLILNSILTKTLPISLRLDNYILVLILLFCQMTIKTTIYETVKVEELKKGMILTTFSSMMMQSSITKGLPGVSTEDLKSRLTSEEVDSIKIWAKATHTESLTVVKKIPFAIFITIGIMLYCAIWSILL